MSRLDALAWPADRLAEALAALAGRAGLGSAGAATAEAAPTAQDVTGD